jgi:hypothetical protein
MRCLFGPTTPRSGIGCQQSRLMTGP